MQTVPPEQIPEIVAQVVAHLVAAGMVIVPADSVVNQSKLITKRKQLMKQRAVTLVKVEKYKLLPFTRSTLKKYQREGIFFLKGEIYKHPTTGHWEILTSAIRRWEKEHYN